MANNIEEFESTDLVTMANVNERINATNTALQALSQTVASGVKIATGSYTGTGTYGASNPNTLTFEFVPKIVFFTSNYGTGAFPYIWGDSRIITCASNINYQCVVTLSGNSMTWYSTSEPFAQLNEKNGVYRYIAIG